MHGIDGMRFGVVGASDLDRSLEFYSGVLQFKLVERWPVEGGERARLESEGRLIEIVSLDSDRGDSAWANDNLQLGMRHVGFKVDDLDAWAERVRSAGATFTLEPLDAFGGVRICFFLDPDGTHLELVEGNIKYNKIWSQGLVDAVVGAAVPTSPRFDHVAVSVSDLDRALAFYERDLGFPVIGQLLRDDDPRGFTLTYLQAGPAVLELFSFRDPVSSNYFDPANETPGLLHVGLGAGDVMLGVRMLEGAGAKLVRPAGSAGSAPLFTDPDGTPLEVVGSWEENR